MATTQQRSRLSLLKKKRIKKKPALKGKPQIKGQVAQIAIRTPKKPNSARRLIARVALRKKKLILGRIPGKSFSIKKYSVVLVRGGGSRDLAGNEYTCSRGVYDLEGLREKLRRRSIYGAKKDPATKK